MPEPVTTSIELSKRLHDLGVRRESYFVYGRTQTGSEWRLVESEIWANFSKRFLANDQVAALQADELWPVMPEQIGDSAFECYRDGALTKVGYSSDYGGAATDMRCDGPSLAESLGLLLAYLIENGLVTVEEVNGS
ncbi:MAG: hypothetical protein WC683_04770 [bacterium]